MTLDIHTILDGWPYEPGQVTARRIRGADGRDKIQLRLDLGVLQMEVDGRPDGKRPHGQESLLEYYQAQLHAYVAQQGSAQGFVIDERACELLRAESMMYYHRYLAEFVLEDFVAVERDTRRNLAVMDFCSAYGEEESDKYVLEQYRPYVVMMNARAKARVSLDEGRPKGALTAVKAGVEAIRDFYRRFGQEDAFNNSGEVAILRALAKEVELRIPADPVVKLRRALAKAVREERYEEAAALRDEIRRTTGHEKTEE